MPLPVNYEENKNRVLREMGVQDPENYDVLPDGKVTRRAAPPMPAAPTPEPEKMGAGQAFLRGFVGDLPEAAGGILGGAATGAALGTLGVPVIGTAIGAIAGGFAGAYGAGKLEEAVAPQAFLDWQNEARVQRPLAAGAGSIASQLPFMRPGLRPLQQASRMFRTGMKATGPQIESAFNVGLGAGLSGGGSIASDLVRGEDIDWKRAALETAAGAVMNTPTRLTQKMTRGYFRPDAIDMLPEDFQQRAQENEISTEATATPPQTRKFPSDVVSALRDLGFRTKYNLADDDATSAFMSRVVEIVRSPEKKVKNSRAKLDVKIRSIEDSLPLLDSVARPEAEGQLAKLKLDRAILDDAFKLRGLVDEYDKIPKVRGDEGATREAVADTDEPTLIDKAIRSGRIDKRIGVDRPDAALGEPMPAEGITPIDIALGPKRAENVAKEKFAQEIEALNEVLRNKPIQQPEVRPEQSPEGYLANMRVGKSNAAASRESADDLDMRRLEARLAGESRPRYQPAPEAPAAAPLPAEQQGAVDYARERLGTRMTFKPKITDEAGVPVRGVNIGRKTPVDLALAEISSELGTPDTPYHELLHQQIRDIRDGADASENKLVDKMLRNSGGDEEKLVQAGGEDFYRRMVDKKSDSFLRDFSDMLRLRFGSKDADVAARQLSAGMRYGRGAAERGLGPDAVKPRAVVTGGDEEKTQRVEESSAFTSAAQKAFASDRPFNLTLANDGTLPRQNVEAAIRKYLPADEQELIRAAGWDEFVAGLERVPVAEARKWLNDNMPKVEVKELYAKQEVDPELLKLRQKEAEIRHKIDTQSAGQTEETRMLWEGELSVAQNAIRRYQWTHPSEPNDSATARYESVNPRELDEMPGAVDLLVRMPTKKPLANRFKMGRGGDLSRVNSEDAILPASKTHYSREGDNLLTHVRAYEHTLPDGRRVLRVFELQSDWAQKRKKVDDYEEKVAQINEKRTAANDEYWNAPEGSPRLAELRQQFLELGAEERALRSPDSGIPNHPLLPHVQRLGIKAAIEHARKKGLDGIVIDDAPTAMMTEGHDQVRVETRSIEDVAAMRGGDFVLKSAYGNDWRDGKYIEFRGSVYRVDKPEVQRGRFVDIARELAPYHGHDGYYIPQRKGMELAYDKVLPDMAEKITGARGEPVELGPHKNAMGDPGGREDEIFETEQAARNWAGQSGLVEARDGVFMASRPFAPKPRTDFAFTDYKTGKGKTTSTGRLYPIAEPAARRERGEPFSLTGAKYQRADSTRFQREIRSENFKKWFGDWERINKLRERQFRGDSSVTPEISRLVAERSEVVDSMGRPKVYFHGTKRSGFTEFDMNRTVELGAHFGPEYQANDFVVKPDNKESIAYWEAATDPKAFLSYDYTRADGVYPVVLNIKKPFHAPDLFGTDPAKFVAWLRKVDEWDDAMFNQYKADAGQDYGSGWRFIKEWIKNKGYDGIKYINQHEGRVGEPDNESWIAFEPTQIKSAIANKGTYDPSDPDIRYQRLGPKEHGLDTKSRRLSRNFFSSAVDNLRAGGGATHKYVADGFQKLYNTARMYRGQYETPVAEALAPLSDKQKRTLLEELYNERDGARLAGDTRRAFGVIRNTLRQIALDQIAAGQRVQTPSGKFKTRGVDPKYFPNVINHETLRILIEDSKSPAFAKLRDDFVKYNAARGVPKPDEIFDRLINALNKSTRPRRGGIEFNAMRMIESSKLPPSWMENDLDTLMRRYIARVAKDRAYFDVVEKDERMAAGLGEDTWMQDRPVDKIKHESLGGLNEVRQMVEQYRNDNVNDAQFARSFGRLIHSLILSGPKTRLTDFATSPIKALAYAPPGARLSTMLKGLNELVTNWGGVRGTAMRTGFVRPGDQIVRNEVLGMGERAAQGMDRAAELAVKWTGAEAIERGSRVVSQALGDAIGQAWRVRARRGDKRAISFLEKLGADWKTISDAELGTRIGQLFQGRYDAVNLPTWATNSELAPFLSMARWNIEQWNNFKKFAIDSLRKDGDPSMLIAQVIAGVAGGLGISELRDYITGRENYTATFKELAEAPDKERATEELIAKLAEAAAVTGTVGIIGELMKQTYDVYQKKLPQGFRYPALSVATDVFKKAASMADAIIEGEDPLAVALQGGHDILAQNVQFLRFIEEQTARAGGPGSDERARKIGRRNYQMFSRLAGYDVQAPPLGVPAYRGLSERRFDREQDPRAAVEQAQSLVRRAIQRADGDPSKLAAELRKLRTSQITFAPSFMNDPLKFKRYLDYVERVQGTEAKEKLLADYKRAAALKKAKASMIPN